MSVNEVEKWNSFYESFSLPPEGAENESIYREVADYIKKLSFSSACPRTLEAGCGSGLHSLALARTGFQTSLLDFSREAIATSKKVFDRAGASADFYMGDVYKDDDLLGYDVTFNSGVLEHYTFKEQVRFVGALAKRSSKYVLILVPNRECYWYWIWRIYKQSKDDWPFGYEKPTTDYSKVFSHAGIDLLEKAFFGSSWTNDFVNGIGLPCELSSLISQVHVSGIVDISTRSYLVGFLGVKKTTVQNEDDCCKITSVPATQVAKSDYGDQSIALAADALATMIHSRSSDRIAREREILNLNKIVAEQETQITDLTQRVAEREAQVTDLTQRVAEYGSELENSLSEVEWERQETMKLSNWAHQIDSFPIRYGMRKYLRTAAKFIYHSLPLDTANKQKLKAKVRCLVQPSTGTKNKIIAPAIEIDHKISLPVQDGLADNKMASTNLLNLANGGDLKGRDLFVFSVIDWHFRIQRPQHLARGFAKTGKRVFFFSNHFIDSAQPGYDLERLDSRLELYQVKLHVSGAPAIYFAPPTGEVIAMIQNGIAQLILDFAAVSSISLVQHAYWYPVADNLPNTIKVYDCMDNHEGFGNVPAKLIEIEKRMLRNSDLVVTTSSWLENFAQDYNQNVAVVRNAGEYEHFCETPTERYTDQLGRKIIGYYGAIAEWFDLDLIRSIAVANPNALVLLIGNDTVNAQKQLKKIPNVVFVGEVPYSQLPYYLYAFDVCLLPFQVIPLTLATNPVKVYEYLAAGKPVVSVDLPEIEQFGDLVYLAKSHDEFVSMVSDSLTHQEAASLFDLRREFAREQTWDHRVEVMTHAIHETPFPKISVVVLTYNNLDLTKDCLNSIIRWSDYPNLELVIVDNASSDGSPEYLTAFAEQHSQVKLLLNEDNLGFAAGNNVGLEAATGDYLVMLNNDTIVTPGWLLTMLRHLQADERIGIIGPVTNNIGNEAKIEIDYSSPTEMLTEAMHYTLSHMAQAIPLQTAAFFCVMLSRNVFEQVGLLDEDFGRGFFEDDDYCRRIEAIGLRVVCAEDVFIHHHLSASFDKLKSQERQKLFKKNKTIYEAKWGKWVQHTYDRGPQGE
ncbi:MAG: glycosyltransferase [Desulfuromonadaceae bacterium]|nr:glycosyltransferase [Desulfuromonadaceae bacterium]